GRDPEPANRPNKWRALQPDSWVWRGMERIPTGIRLARLPGPLVIYLGEFPFEVTDFQAYNLKNFVSTPFSPNEENGRSRYTQKSGYEFHCRFVRFAFDCRRI